ncbi:hypothetical protein [Cytobacillus praedii]|uniref:hypothetical protein n=1 Tax=Cytobacillus praedii TaxID=1742358 RepID=UPI002E23F1A9|nr:hypothetical protein [Cytobacillus praedii]
MLHESNKMNELVISRSNLSFEKIYSKSYFPSELEEDMKKANLLLIPFEEVSTFEGPVFPEETNKFYEYIKNYDNKELVGEICISDDDYVEVELHADLITLAHIIVDIAVFSFTVTLIANYLEGKIQGRENKSDVKAKVNLTVVAGDKSINISYEGDADKFEETINAANQPGN